MSLEPLLQFIEFLFMNVGVGGLTTHRHRVRGSSGNLAMQCIDDDVIDIVAIACCLLPFHERRELLGLPSDIKCNDA